MQHHLHHVFINLPQATACLATIGTIGRKLVKGKVNHGEGRGKAASWELATNWNKKKTEAGEEERWSVWTNFDGENMQRGKCFTLQSESGQFAYFPTHFRIFFRYHHLSS